MQYVPKYLGIKTQKSENNDVGTNVIASINVGSVSQEDVGSDCWISTNLPRSIEVI